MIESPDLIRSFGSHLNNPSNRDVEFCVEDRPVYAHRDILASRSPYFKAMFDFQKREGLEKQSDSVDQPSPAVVHIPNFTYDTFLAVLTFLYTNKIPTTVDPSDLYTAADMYQLDDLQTLAELRIIENLTPQNCSTHLFEYGYKHDSLRPKLVKYMVEHFDEVHPTASFQEHVDGFNGTLKEIMVALARSKH